MYILNMPCLVSQIFFFFLKYEKAGVQEKKKERLKKKREVEEKIRAKGYRERKKV